MIKVSKNDPWTRAGFTFMWTFPALIILLVGISRSDHILDVFICVLLIIALTTLNIYINYFDYEIFFDETSNDWIVKRYKIEYRFSIKESIKIRPYYNLLIAKGFQNYRFEVSGKKFRFKYTYIEKGFQPFKSLDTIAQEIQNEMLQTVSVV